eukprot:TRINITY_DN29321_c0_g1_i1.p1 TRINITY_DN29321_c0_g1~~TRINITY_DN29321_c0_g1_i1.p1  ORF type:complete len:498 (-),score=66.31 TRINITY_DN29321_c0_g1_i1:667-2160(-)
MSDPLNKFRQFGLQIRSVLDEPGSPHDETWGTLLTSGFVLAHSTTQLQLALPGSAASEACFTEVLEALAEALSPSTEDFCTKRFVQFYRHFGWDNAAQYFDTMGSCQVAFVDTDHNDLDDRWAIVLLACQMASANLARIEAGGETATTSATRTQPSPRCTLLCDCRTYETSGIVIWRTLRLCARLTSAFEVCGLGVEIVVSDRTRALSVCAEYLGVVAEHGALDGVVEGAGWALDVSNTGPGSAQTTLRSRLSCDAVIVMSVWLMSGLCEQQVEDLESVSAAHPQMLLRIYEQAQPAWQSTPVCPSTEIQPPWDSENLLPETGYGVEPSNIRSSAMPYPETLQTYMRLQHMIEASSNISIFVPALSRSEARMPAPPGKPMLLVSGRSLNVLPGDKYDVLKACDSSLADRAFSNVLAAVHDTWPRSLYPELLTGLTDDFGNERPELHTIMKYGTCMSDSILFALAARPAAAHHQLMVCRQVQRRLAIVSDRSKLVKPP